MTEYEKKCQVVIDLLVDNWKDAISNAKCHHEVKTIDSSYTDMLVDLVATCGRWK